MRALYLLFILPLSRLPLSTLYRVSDLLYGLVWNLIGYRKRVVLENLRKAFPERPEGERIQIASRFYRHFCDLIVESFHAFQIGEKQMIERMTVDNPDILEPFLKSGQDVVIVGGHYNNWEWLAVGLDPQLEHQTVAIYKPLSDRFMDAKLRESRTRFGTRMIAMSEVPSLFASRGPLPRAIIFAIDQSPGSPSKAHWTRFLNQASGVVFGAEKYARENNLPVVFGSIRKTARGVYRFHMTEVTRHPQELRHGEIMEKATRLLEDQIRREPEFWLWTHRRWKHRMPKDPRSVSPELEMKP